MLLKGATRWQIRIDWVIYAAILTDNRGTTQSFILLSDPGPTDHYRVQYPSQLSLLPEMKTYLSHQE
jgi:hypothetical protein